MAQWNHAEKTLYTKIVYYGPAFGGKTTNLESLHRLTDPDGDASLVSVKTADDRTLFFDLLPVDLGDVLGYRVAIKLYTVPGQVRYDATRRVVLSGADAVVFVADSSTGREEQNRWSLQNLRMHMRELRLDPSTVPVVFQFNKQDRDDAAPPEIVARWLRVGLEDGEPAVAVAGRGVLETFSRVGRAMLVGLVERADERTRRHVDASSLEERLERAFARYGSGGTEGEAAATGPRIPVVVTDDDVQRSAVRAGVRLGETLTAHAARARRLEREVEALRALADASRAVGASFDRDEIVGSALATLADVLDPVTACLCRVEGERLRVERSVGGAGRRTTTVKPFREPVVRAVGRGQVAVIDDAADECGAAADGPHAVVIAPVDDARALLVWSDDPERRFGEPDARFVATVGAHLAVGLEKSRLYAEVGDHKAALGRRVEQRTVQLRQAYRDLQSLDEMKDRFLGNVSHEMRTPLTAILGAGACLRDYEGGNEERAELAASIVEAGERLREHLDTLLRLAGNDDDAEAHALADTDVVRVIEEAVAIAGRPDVTVEVAADLPPLRADEDRLARAIANLIDNACKFSAGGGDVRVVAAGTGDDGGALVVSVLDRGPGVPVEDRERIFAAFEQGGGALTDKPSGVGLGLHEARRIVESHEGRIECLDRPDGGAEFRVLVPWRPAGVAEEVAGG